MATNRHIIEDSHTKIKIDLDKILKKNHHLNLSRPVLACFEAQKRCQIHFDLDAESWKKIDIVKAIRDQDDDLLAPLKLLLKNYFPEGVTCGAHFKVTILDKTSYQIILIIKGDLHITKNLSENLINDIKEWYAERSAYTQGAIAGLFCEKLPKEVGAHVGKFLDHKSGSRTSQVNRQANIQAKYDADAIRNKI